MKRISALLLLATAPAFAAERERANPMVVAALEQDDARAAYAAAVPQLEACQKAHPNDDTCVDMAGLVASLAVDVEPRAARARFAAALALADRTVQPEGEDHARLAGSLASVLAGEGRAREAVPHAQRSARLWAAARGATAQRAVDAALFEASLYGLVGQGDAAVARLRPLLAAAVAAKAGPQVELALRRGLADALVAIGDTRGAEGAYRDALPLALALKDADSEQAILLDLAKLLAARGEKAGAAALARRVVASVRPGSARALRAAELIAAAPVAPEEAMLRAQVDRIRRDQGAGSPALPLAEARLAIWLEEHGRRAETVDMMKRINAALADPATLPRVRNGIFWSFAGYHLRRGAHADALAAFAAAHRAALLAFDEADPLLIEQEAGYGGAAMIAGDNSRARRLLMSAQLRTLRRLAATPDFDAPAQAELRSRAPLFRWLVRTDWQLAAAGR
ncbi:hypothetical protein ABS767_07690 [Sphingomonas sp. ST-64]|uniref:Tetratricopeptide repeat-containing protein n=1 Tax=Sphingomonas plantiphila TaxID=3163295 RepID=A0ABW8YLP9_9SPHN